MQINKKKLLAFIFLITACVVGFVVVYRYFDSVPVSFTAINLEKISIKTSTGAVLHESANPSNFSVRVPKQTTIEVEFNGKEGYETNTKNERIGNKPKTISIKPYYSESRLAKLAANEEMTLIAVLKKEYSPVISKYSLSNFTLYHFGEWASVTLRQTGELVGRTDTWKVILKKESGGWNIKASPALLFYENNHEDIPVDILRRINYS